MVSDIDDQQWEGKHNFLIAAQSTAPSIYRGLLPPTFAFVSAYVYHTIPLNQMLNSGLCTNLY